MRTFRLVRDEDASGVSGVGVVAEGVEFSSGKCALGWCVAPAHSVAVYDSLADLVRIHGHGGKSRVVWLDNVAGAR